MTMNLGLWDFVLFYFVFETGSHCVVLVGLELTLWTRMVLNSQICMSLPPPPVLELKVYTTISTLSFLRWDLTL